MNESRTNNFVFFPTKGAPSRLNKSRNLTGLWRVERWKWFSARLELILVPGPGHAAGEPAGCKQCLQWVGIRPSTRSPCPFFRSESETIVPKRVSNYL